MCESMSDLAIIIFSFMLGHKKWFESVGHFNVNIIGKSLVLEAIGHDSWHDDDDDDNNNNAISQWHNGPLQKFMKN